MSAPVPADTVPVDEAARERVRAGALGETLFVEAGAGTGKTRELVERVVHLVVDAGVPLRDVAAITFTEAAATELRDRLREAFERRLAALSATPEGSADAEDQAAAERPGVAEAEACRAALEDADLAAICTLHAFALRLLREHPVEVGLPPRVEVLDEVASQLAFERRWEDFVEQLYDDPDSQELVLRAEALGVRIEPRGGATASLKHVAAVFDDNWDRLETLQRPGPLPPVDLAPLAGAVDELEALASACTDADDPLLRAIEDEVVPTARGVLAEPDPLRRLEVLPARDASEWKVGNRGRKANWPDAGAVRAACRAVADAAGQVREAAQSAVLRRLVWRLAGATLAAADARRAEGLLEYHDLLVLARQLLRDHAAARRALARRYRRLLLDEFQDTDPIQVELAALLARAVDGAPSGAGSWREVPTEAGRLFFVGDPKQSIYRFRRADIATFLAARATFGGGGASGGGGVVRLRQSFRTVAPILEWINHTFASLMGDGVPGSQPSYEPLAPFRRGEPGDHRVAVLGGALEGHDAAGARDAEAADVAAALAAVRDDPDAWPVHDRDEGWRPARLSDVVVLLPTRTSLRHLEDALDRAGVPYRVDTGTLLYDTQEVGEVLAAVRAVDDPSDQIALVSALRSPLYGCSDVDLLTFRQAGGRWDLHAPPPPGLGTDHPVVAALGHLRTVAADRWWAGPSGLVERFLRERHAFALGLTHRRPREVWRRLRFLLDQARAFEESGRGGVRDFLDWTDLQRHEGTRVHEPVLAEPDDEAVSIRTVHAAKGLEFPITVVSGVTTRIRRRRQGVQVVWHAGGPEVRIRQGVATEGFDRVADLEAEMDDHERHRLLYVACTRARDHLLVCAHHVPAGEESLGSLLTRHGTDAPVTSWRRLPHRPPPSVSAPLRLPLRADDDRAGWIAAREALLAPHRRARFVAATALVGAPGGDVATAAGGAPTPGAAESGTAGPLDGDATRRRLVSGSAVGRAVHATLQRVDLATGEGLDELAASRAEAEGVPDAAGTVAAMARAGLGAPSVGRALAAGRWWREVYVAAPVGGRAVEGYVDLLYDDPDAGGLVVVDYKTDAGAVDGADARLDELVATYAPQAAAYAVALEASTGLPVVDARLVFCSPAGAVERAVPDLPAATAAVRATLGDDPPPP